MNTFYNKHYIITDTQSRITDGWSDGPHRDRDTAGAICINEQGGYQFRLLPDGEENPTLYTMDGIPLYRWDGKPILRTDEEIEADRKARPEPEPNAATLTQLAIAELAQVVEDNNTANQLAIAELAEAMIGGEENG